MENLNHILADFDKKSIVKALADLEPHVLASALIASLGRMGYTDLSFTNKQGEKVIISCLDIYVFAHKPDLIKLECVSNKLEEWGEFINVRK